MAFSKKTQAWIAVTLLSVSVQLPAFAQASVWVQKNAAAETAYTNNDFATAEHGWLDALSEARALGRNDPRVAETLSELGTLYKRTERYEESVAMLRGALRIKQSIYGADSPEMKNDLEAYTTSLRLLGEDELADSAALRLERVLLLHPVNRGTASDSQELANVPVECKTSMKSDLAKNTVQSPHDTAARSLDALKEGDRTGSNQSSAVASIGQAIRELTASGYAVAAEQLADEALGELQRSKGYQNTQVAYILSMRAEALRAEGNGSAALADSMRANNIYSHVTQTIEASRPVATAYVHREPMLLANVSRNSFTTASLDDGSAAWRSKLISLVHDEEATIKASELSEIESLESRQRAALLHSLRHRRFFYR